MMKTMKDIAQKIEDVGGKMFIVGGAVRDMIRGVKPMDFDFMVSGIEQSVAMDIVSQFGVIVEADAISNAPVFIARIDGWDVEIAMARIDVDVAPGKHGFQFISDPSISPLDDAVRRDFTVGAIFQEVLSGAIFDPFDGQSDVMSGILRHVSDETFVKSPERVFRGAAQSARFGWVVAPETLKLMQIMRKDAATIPAEQIWRHIEKVGKGAEKPFFFLDVLVKARWDSLFPEIKAAKAAKALFALEKLEKWDVVDFVAALVAGMSYMEEQSFFERICCPKQIAKWAVEVKHFGQGGKPTAWVQGRDLFHLFSPGKSMGKAVQWAYIAQINGIFDSKEAVLAWIAENVDEF